MSDPTKSGSREILFWIALLPPVLWLAALLAQSYIPGTKLDALLESVTSTLQQPFALQWTDRTAAFLLAAVLLYGLGISAYYATRGNTRLREEHGSARWGKAGQVNGKYADHKRPESNVILTRHVKMGMDGRKHRRNLNVLVVGGSGSGKTRYFAKPNVMQANCSYIIADPKAEMLRSVGPLLEAKGYDIKVFDLINMEQSDAYNPFAYGESSKPKGEANHSTYSKRTMANDQMYVMQHLGFSRFHIVGHDRGGRVCHRLLLDHPDKVKSAVMIDIIPTIDVYDRTDQEIATKYWHWFFYIQPEPFPEKFLGSQPEYFIRSNILKKTISGSLAADTFPEDIVQEYIRYYSNPATVHAIAEDYRAGVTIDWEHDLPDRENKTEVPIMCIWGSNGNICKIWDVAEIWRNLASNVIGCEVPGCGHFVPEEKPEITIQKIREHIEKNK